MGYNNDEELVVSDTDERVSLIEHERLIDDLLASSQSCFKAFPNQLEPLFLEQQFQQTRIGFRLSLVLMGIFALLMVLGNQVMPQFALITASNITFGQFIPLWLAIGLILFFMRLENFSVDNQLHLYLLVLTNTLVYSDLSAQLNFGVGSLVSVFLMMLGQSVLLLMAQVNRVIGLILAVCSVMVFNLVSAVTLGSALKDVWPMFAFCNLMIVSLCFAVLWINAFSEVSSRMRFLESQRKSVKGQMRGQTNNVAQLFAVPNAPDRISKQLVSIDPRTGLANTKSFQRYMNEAWSGAYNARQCLALILVDLGHPPFVSYDCEEAEQLDRQAREEMKRFARRDGDLIGCYDETSYGILLINTDLQSARTLAEKLIQLLQQLYAPHRDRFIPGEQQKHLNFGINIGVASALPMPGIKAQDLAQRAEQALLGAIEKKQVNIP